MKTVPAPSAPSKVISKLARIQPPSLHDHALQLHLQTRLIMASKYISKLAWSWPPSASLNSLDHSLQVYLCTRPITASKFAWSHQQNVIWFSSHNRTTQQLWTATLILPDAPRWSQIGWMQSDVLSGAPRLLYWCSWILWKLWNRIQAYPEECIVVLKMLPYQTIRRCKFRNYCEYWPCLQEYSGAPRTLIHTLRKWLS
jgi:hypothetical protein